MTDCVSLFVYYITCLSAYTSQFLLACCIQGVLQNRPQQMKAGHMLLEECCSVRKVVFFTGSVDILFVNPRHKEAPTVLQANITNSVVGLGAALHGWPQMASVRACSDGEYLEIPWAELDNTPAKVPNPNPTQHHAVFFAASTVFGCCYAQLPLLTSSS